MASTFTAFLKFNKPALGDAGWGTAVNGGFTDLVDQAITGFIEKAVTAAGPNALGSIADGASSDARNQFILLTGTLASPATLTVPVGTLTGSAGNNKLYFIKNTAGNSVTITNGGASTVVVPDGKSMMLRSTSTGVEEAMTHQFSLSLGTALAAPSGGTGQSSYAVGDLLYADTTTTLAKLTVGAANAVLTSSGTAPQWSATLPVASGGTGAATLAANNVLLGNGTSAVQEVAPGTTGNVLRSNGTTWTSSALSSATDTAEGLVELATTTEVQTGTDTSRVITPAGLRGGALVRMAVQYPGGSSSAPFTGIPSWVKRITIMIMSLSTSGTSPVLIQLGRSVGFQISAYDTSASYGGSAGNYSGSATPGNDTGFFIDAGNVAVAAAYRHGMVVLTNLNNNVWVCSGSVSNTQVVSCIAGSVTLADTLTQIRLITQNSTDTFDSGMVNVIYE